MSISTFSEHHINFFTKYYSINYDLHFTNKFFKKIILKFYNEIENSLNWANTNFDDLNININKIDIISEIPKPSGFSSKYIPSSIKQTILNNSQFVINYNFKLDSRKIDIIFVIEDEKVNHKKFDYYFKLIMSWIYFANQYSPKACGKNLKIYIFLNPDLKVLPNSQLKTIDLININSGMSDTCSYNSEIIIFRKEEWFKVLIHEIFHNYGLDFSIMNLELVKSSFKKEFNINSEFAIYETYTEFWARIINVLYCAKLINQPSNNNLSKVKKFNNFYLYFQILLSYERIFTIFQCVKILNFMNLDYNDIIDSSQRQKSLLLYKENTNVFPYYIGVALLFINPIHFIIKCENENINILRFKKTNESLDNFCKYLIKISKQQETINEFKKMYGLVSKSPKELIQTTRMTLIELQNI